MYISAWDAHKDGMRNSLQAAVKRGEIDQNDIVWRGPSGDAVVTSDPASLNEEYADYTDSGQVSEYLD